MAQENDANDARTYGQQTPGPNLALRSLDRLVGTWEKSDPGGAVDGRATYEWMEGGFFLIQRVDLGQEGTGWRSSATSGGSRLSRART